MLRQRIGQRAAEQIRYLTPVPPAAATDTVSVVYGELERDFGLLAPPVTLHSPVPELLAGCWLMLRETLLAEGPLKRPGREAVATVVSAANRCPYCVDVHGGAVQALVRPRDAAALRSGRTAAVTDLRLRDLAEWAQAGTTSVAARPPRHRGLAAAELAPAIGVSVTFHYLNRMVNVFLADGVLPGLLPAPARAGAFWVISRLMRSSVGRTVVPGGSANLLPAAALPEDFRWVGESSEMAEAFARTAGAIERARRRSVPVSVHRLLSRYLASWDGQPPLLSRQWVESAVAPLPATDRAAGRLALLTAVASFQVTAADVADVQRDRPGDAALLELTSWAAFSAARRTAEWASG